VQGKLAYIFKLGPVSGERGQQALWSFLSPAPLSGLLLAMFLVFAASEILL
jgi:hypothetical protein